MLLIAAYEIHSPSPFLLRYRPFPQFFSSMPATERLCFNNYCTCTHECKISPIEEGGACFDLRPGYQCKGGSCVKK